MILFKLARRFSVLSFKERAVLTHNETAKEMLDELVKIHSNTKISLFDTIAAYKTVSNAFMHKSLRYSQYLRMGIFNQTGVTDYIPIKRSMDSLDEELRQKLDIELEVMLTNMLLILNKIDQLEPLANSTTSLQEKYNLYIMFFNAFNRFFTYEFMGIKPKAFKVYQAFWQSFNNHTQGITFDDVTSDKIFFRFILLIRLLEFALNSNIGAIKELNTDMHNLFHEINNMNIHKKCFVYSKLRDSTISMPAINKLIYNFLDDFCREYVYTDFDLEKLSDNEIFLYFKNLENILTVFTIDKTNNEFNITYINTWLMAFAKKHPKFKYNFYNIVLKVLYSAKNIHIIYLTPELVDFVLYELQNPTIIIKYATINEILYTFMMLAENVVGSNFDQRFSHITSYTDYFRKRLTAMLETKAIAFNKAIQSDIDLAITGLNFVNSRKDDLIHETKAKIAYLSAHGVYGSNASFVTLLGKLFVYNYIHKDGEYGELLPEPAMCFNRFAQTLIDNIARFNLTDFIYMIGVLKYANHSKVEHLMMLIHGNNASLEPTSRIFLHQFMFWHTMLYNYETIYDNSEYFQSQFNRYITYYTRELRINKAKMFLLPDSFDMRDIVSDILIRLQKILEYIKIRDNTEITRNTQEWQRLNGLLELCMEVVMIDLDKLVVNPVNEDYAYIKNTYKDISLCISLLSLTSMKTGFMVRSRDFLAAYFKNRILELLNEPSYYILADLLYVIFNTNSFPLYLKQWIMEISISVFEFVEHKISTQALEPYLFVDDLLLLCWRTIWIKNQDIENPDHQKKITIFKNAAVSMFYKYSAEGILDKQADYLLKIVVLDPHADDTVKRMIKILSEDYWKAYFSYKDESLRDTELSFIELQLYAILRLIFIKNTINIDLMDESFKELLFHLNNKKQKQEEIWNIVRYRALSYDSDIAYFSLLHLALRAGLKFSKKNFCGLSCDIYHENTKTYYCVLKRTMTSLSKSLWVYDLLADLSGVKLKFIDMYEVSPYPIDIVKYFKEEIEGNK